MKHHPATLYDRDLDIFAIAEMKNPGSATPEKLYKRMQVYHAIRIAEGLLLADTLVFRVYGENVIAPLLMRTFGVDGARRLIVNGAVKFLLATEGVVFIEDDKVAHQQGLIPIAPIKLNSAAHRDPEASATLGLRGWARDILDDKKLRNVARHIADATAPMTQDGAASVVQRVVEAYGRGDLSPAGFSPDIPIDRLSHDQRKGLNSLATDLHEGVLMIEKGMDLLDGDDVWAAIKCGLSQVTLDGKLRTTTEAITNIEGLPAIKELFVSGVLKLSDVVSLRARPETVAFRNWLWTQPDPADATAVSREYVTKIVGQKDAWKDSKWFKYGRMSTLSIGGSILGTLVGGPLGGAAGFAAGTAAGLASSLVDDALATRAHRGRLPRRFITDILGPAAADLRSRQPQA